MMIDKRSNKTEWDLVPHQQEGFVGLMSTALNAYMNLLRIPFIPFSFDHMEVDGTEATYQATEAATQPVRQLAEQSSFPHHLFEVAITEGIPQIPADTQQDALSFKVAPFEGGASVQGSGSSQSSKLRRFYLITTVF